MKTCAKCGQSHPKCSGHNRRGVPCGRFPVPGARVCVLHGGGIPKVATKAAVRHEMSKWVPGDMTIDPGEALLRLVTQSSRRAALYASLLEQQYERAANGGTAADLPGGVSVLIGYKYSLDKEGNAVPVEEAIRGLVELEIRERELLAGFASKAIAAGLAERQVRIAEKQGALLADVLRAVLADPALGLTAEQRSAAPSVIRAHLGLAGAPLTIEGGQS
jgi:hypothetical protein